MSIKFGNRYEENGPKPRSTLHPIGLVVKLPSIFTISLASILHFHQFMYIHQIIPNLLLNYASEGKIPLALLGLQFVFTYYLTAVMAVSFRALYSIKGYDNNHPRRDRILLEGVTARIQAAHENSLENFPAFASAVIVGTICEIPQDKLIYFATCFNLARAGHFAAYAINTAPLRSIFFHIGSACVLLIYLFSVVEDFDVYFEQLCRYFFATPF